MPSDIGIKRGDDLPLYLTFTSTNLSVYFTCNAFTVAPLVGDIYALGDTVFTITSISGTLLRTISTSSLSPSATGTLTKIIGSGDSSITFTSITTSNNVDLTNSKIYFSVKKVDTDTDANALISVSWTTHINAVDGISSYTIPNSMTNIAVGDWKYEIQIKNAFNQIFSSDTGNFIVYQDIVQSTL